MGGFYPSWKLKELLQHFDESSHTDEYYEALEQCIVLMEEYESMERRSLQFFLAKKGNDAR